MDVELNVAERLGLLALLPREERLATMRVIHDLRMHLSFSEDELEALQFKTVNDQIRWEPTAERSKSVSFGTMATRLIQDKLIELNEAGKVREEHLSLCDKFSVE